MLLNVTTVYFDYLVQTFNWESNQEQNRNKLITLLLTIGVAVLLDKSAHVS